MRIMEPSPPDLYDKDVGVFKAELRRIEGLRVKNFTAIDDFTIGSLVLEFEDGTEIQVTALSESQLEIDLKAPSGVFDHYPVILGYQDDEE